MCFSLPLFLQMLFVPGVSRYPKMDSSVVVNAISQCTVVVHVRYLTGGKVVIEVSVQVLWSFSLIVRTN